VTVPLHFTATLLQLKSIKKYMSLEFKSYRVGSSDLTGNAIGPFRPIHRRGKSSFRQFLQSNQKEKKSRQSLQIFGHVGYDYQILKQRFAEKTTFRFRQSLRTYTVIVSNN
jgi:hypothetical protein